MAFQQESKPYLWTSYKAGFFSNEKYDSYTCWTYTELCEAFNFLMENIYVQIDGMVYQQIVGIPMGTNCAPLIVKLLEGFDVKPTEIQTVWPHWQIQRCGCLILKLHWFREMD